MKLKTLKDLDVKGKVVLLRSDLNSDIVRGKVLKGERISESIKSINFLRKAGARVVILAHQGNPGKKDFLDLKQHAKLLGKFVKFVDDVVGVKAVNSIKEMKDGDVILLDNVRTVDDEFKPKKWGNVLKKRLLPLVDVYVNDAFSVSHREHTSIVGFAKVKEKGIGLLFEKEIRALENFGGTRNSVPSKMGAGAPSSSGRDCLFILGGSKPQDNIKLLGRGRAIVCGLFGQTCLAAKGFDFGYQNDFLRKTVLVKGGYDKFLKKLRNKLDNVEMPVDFAVDFSPRDDSGEPKGKRKEFKLEDFPMNYEIEDIGEESIKKFRRIIKGAKAVYMKGPAGWAEDKRFRKGTVEILKAVADCKGFSLVGGGQLSEAIMKSKIPKGKFGHISLSGGALLSFVAGEKLVGLKALGYY
ncbi:MAG: phosphoglycerate kinase [Nanoarchaeota archaeon]|nr:phosphoglycerate kinase [Nanoarchaeota archaeon]